MINRLVWMETDNTYPYRNLAMEEYMTLHVPQGTCILYLWQNRHTVVIGKNQNCWRECRVNFLEQEDGYLVRRLSGGEGRKFSGNAFYRTGDGCYHHGTILIRADKENMSRYLNVSKEKLASKGVTSVKSRVANLCEFKPDITLEEVKAALVEAFSRVYGQPAVRMKEEELPQPEIDVLTEKFASWQWKYGRKIPFEYEMEKRFPWGNIQIQLHVDEGVIQDVNVFSDAMDQEMFGALAKQLKGCGYAEEDICAAVEAVGPDAFQAEEHTGTDVPQSRQIKEDIKALVRESL